MIEKQEVMSLLLEACPSFQDVWGAEFDCVTGEPLVYMDVLEFCVHLTNLFKKNETSEFPNVFEVIERLHVEGNDYVQELATIGLLEGLQNLFDNDDSECLSSEVLVSYLLPESLKWWHHLNDFWGGKTQWVGGPPKAEETT